MTTNSQPQIKTNGQLALSRWHEEMSQHPQRQNPDFYADMIRGMNQVLTVLDHRMKEGFEVFTPLSMREFRTAVRNCRKMFDLSILFDNRHYRWDYWFQPGDHTQEALNYGRRIAVIELRLHAEKYEIEERFRLFNHREELKDWAEYWIYSVAGCAGGLTRQQITAALEKGVFV